MPTNFFRYCRLVFLAAVPTSLSWATFIIGIITIFAGTAIWLVLAFGIIVDASGLMAMLRSPEFFAILVLLVVLIRLLFAQYWIWQGDQKEIAALKDGCHVLQRRKGNIAELHKFYAAVGPIIERQLPKDISEDDFKKYDEEVEAWATNCANWVEQNMGATAKLRFLNLNYMLAIHPREAVNDRHTEIIRVLARFKQNLLALIESEDKAEP